MMRPSANESGRKILFIAYHFPPSAAIGGRRIVNFAVELQSLGWEPQVLTIADKDIEHVDRTRLKDVEGIAIHKASVGPSLARTVEWLWSRVRPRRPAAASNGTQEPRQAQPAAGQPARSRLRRFVLSLLALPDWQRPWIVPATIRGWRILKRDRIDWFMTSCPPYSVHLVGLGLKMATGRRWIADFRDPWMTTGSKRLYPTSSLSMKIERFLERRVIEQADVVTFNVERLRNAYRDRYSWVRPDKFVYIPNGLATSAVNNSARKYDLFTISYTGSLYVGRSPEPVLEAVARLVRDGHVHRDQIRVKLVGQCDPIDDVPTEQVIRKHGLDGIVQVQPPVPYRDAVEIVQRSHLALLLAPNLPYQIPAKVYDYLAAGTRILAIAEEGGTADLLRETASGSAFHTTDVDGIADFIRSEFMARGSAGFNAVSLARYDVKYITRELLAHLADSQSTQAVA